MQQSEPCTTTTRSSGEGAPCNGLARARTAITTHQRRDAGLYPHRQRICRRPGVAIAQRDCWPVDLTEVRLRTRLLAFSAAQLVVFGIVVAASYREVQHTVLPMLAESLRQKTESGLASASRQTLYRASSSTTSRPRRISNARHSLKAKASQGNSLSPSNPWLRLSLVCECGSRARRYDLRRERGGRSRSNVHADDSRRSAGKEA